MTKYVAKFQEIITYEFEVEADNYDNAHLKAQIKFANHYTRDRVSWQTSSEFLDVKLEENCDG